MTENTDITAPATEREAGTTSAAAQVSAPETEKHYNHTEIRGRWDQFRSPYWGLAIGSIGVRYFARPFTRIHWTPENPEKWAYVRKYAYSTFAGAIMYGVASYYARQTWKDMRNIFSETLAWEFDKKPEEVTVSDFRNSKNAIVHKTLSNYAKRNLRRFGINTLFFLPMIPIVGPMIFKSKIFRKMGLDHAESPLDWGVSFNSAYLVSDIMGRKITFFEQLQGFVDSKINHTDRVGEKIIAADLISLYDRHAKDTDPKYTISGRMDTLKWKNDQILFGRMAELMNQTYGNDANKEQVNFTVPKFIYLLGEGLVNPAKMEQSLTYIEIASRYGMEGVKKVAKAASNGVSIKEAAAAFPVVLPTTQEQQTTVLADAPPAQPEPAKAGFAQKVGENRNIISTMPVPHATQAERIMKRNDALAAPGIS